MGPQIAISSEDTSIVCWQVSLDQAGINTNADV